MTKKPIIFDTVKELDEWAYEHSQESIFANGAALAVVFPKRCEKYNISYSTSKENHENGSPKKIYVDIFIDNPYPEAQKIFYELTGLDFTDLTYEKITEMFPEECKKQDRGSRRGRKKLNRRINDDF